MRNIDKVCISWWYPRISGVVPTPKTSIVKTECDLALILDGKKPEGYDDFMGLLKHKARMLRSTPVFLRTGHTSGKHDWDRTCYVPSVDDIATNVFHLVEFSHLASIMGLPHDVWAVREWLHGPHEWLHKPFRNMPVRREFRVFVEDEKIVCIHPYWPADAFEDLDVWSDEPPARDAARDAQVERMNDMSDCEDDLRAIASKVGSALGGAWSVDILAVEGPEPWYVTDCAPAGLSYHGTGCLYEHRWAR